MRKSRKKTKKKKVLFLKNMFELKNAHQNERLQKPKFILCCLVILSGGSGPSLTNACWVMIPACWVSPRAGPPLVELGATVFVVCFIWRAQSLSAGHIWYPYSDGQVGQTHSQLPGDQRRGSLQVCGCAINRWITFMRHTQCNDYVCVLAFSFGSQDRDSL